MSDFKSTLAYFKDTLLECRSSVVGLTKKIHISDYISKETLACAGTVAFISWYFVHRKWQYFKDRDMAYVKPSLSEFGSITGLLADPIGYDLENYKKYGAVYGEFVFLTPGITVHDPDILRQIFIKEFDKFPVRTEMMTLSNGHELNNSLDQIQGPQWKRERAALSPMFSSAKLKHMHGIQNACADELCRILDRKIRNDGGVIEIKDVFGRHALNVLLSSAFNANVCEEINEQEPEVVTQARRLLDVRLGRKPLLWIAMIFPSFEKITSKLGVKFYDGKAYNYFKNLALSLIKRRKENPNNGENDFMQLMLNLEKSEQEIKSADFNGRGLTRTEIIGNAMIFIIAGYENQANILGLLAYDLAFSPEAQERIYEEVEQALDSDGNISYAALNEMKYLSMCLEETLRLYTPAFRLVRLCKKTTTINGVKFEKGVQVNIPSMALHRNPDYWEDPHVFKPERMSDMSKIDQMMHQPFGAGPRNCVAMRFAKIMIKLTIARILAKYRIEPSETTCRPPLAMTAIVSLIPKEPVKLVLNKR